MNNYIDVTVGKDASIRCNVLLNMAYTRLHKALHSLKSTSIGVSFPRCRLTLGATIRIHGSKEDLVELQKRKWLGDMVEACFVSNIKVVPDNAKHRVISRIQQSKTASKLRAKIKAGKISEEAIKRYKIAIMTTGLDNPYLEIESKSNGHKYRRFFKFGDLITTPVTGKFNSFGLSREKKATVPWF